MLPRSNQEDSKDHPIYTSKIYLYKSKNKSGWDILITEASVSISDLVKNSSLCIQKQIIKVNYRTLNDTFLEQSENIPFVLHDCPRDYVSRYRINRKSDEKAIRNIIKKLQ